MMYPRSLARVPFAMRYDRIEDPASDPVTVADIHVQCRIPAGDTGEDLMIESWIAYAVEFAEGYTGRSLITQTWRATADAFPAGCEPQEIFLKHGKVNSIVQITYLATDGSPQTLDPSQYVLDASGTEWRVAPVYGSSWPATRPQLGAVKIDYVAGYGDAVDVPKSITTWIKVRVTTLYEHRDEYEIVPRGKLQPLEFVDAMLDSEKVWSL